MFWRCQLFFMYTSRRVTSRANAARKVHWPLVLNYRRLMAGWQAVSRWRDATWKVNWRASPSNTLNTWYGGWTYRLVSFVKNHLYSQCLHLRACTNKQKQFYFFKLRQTVEIIAWTSLTRCHLAGGIFWICVRPYSCPWNGQSRRRPHASQDDYDAYQLL